MAHQADGVLVLTCCALCVRSQNGPPQYPQYPPDQYADPAAGGRVDPQFSGPQRGQIH